MRFSWLRFGARKPAEPAKPPQAVQAAEPARTAALSSAREDFAEHGITGTSLFSGILRDTGEYNPAVEGLSAFSLYEKMRRSDAQVAATLLAMKLPIRAAEWTVAPPLNPTRVEREATDFVRACLFDDIDFDEVLQNALLMLDFGCAAHEDCWSVRQGRVRLVKLAPRLPVTFYRWITDDHGNLLALEQQSQAGETATIPASKLALFSFQREGGNFAGRSVLRPMYQHWYTKANLYKIEAIALERNGMGIPHIQMAADPTDADRKTARTWLEQICAHERASLLLPPGWQFSLKGVDGKIADPRSSIDHHNVAISMAGLAAFLTVGTGGGGTQEVAETMTEFFLMSLQATAKHIAEVLNASTVKRLVDFNFVVQRYPRVTAQKITSVSPAKVLAALKNLAAVGLIEPDDGLEAWLRTQLGLPAAKASKATGGAEAADRMAALRASSHTVKLLFPIGRSGQREPILFDGR